MHCIVIFHSNSPYAYRSIFCLQGMSWMRLPRISPAQECLLPASRYQPFR
uniref:Uncharacterized protein n=1 Tax=Klebsiella pneumoniae TaxID=573 RepID=A0A3G1IE43_KLEPN|nr:hypothetical protein pPUTH1_0185 [Klebsiella pneumoniae]